MTGTYPNPNPASDVTPDGDRPGFERLFAKFAPRVMGFFVRRGVQTPAAEELTQEVMLSVWRKAEQYDPERASMSTWVYTIARNKHIDAHRRSRRPEPDPEDPCFARGEVDSQEWPDAQASAEQRQQLLHSALDGLPDEQRETLQRLYFEGLTMQETADAMGVPLGTVKSRARRALEALRSHMSEEAPGVP